MAEERRSPYDKYIQKVPAPQPAPSAQLPHCTCGGELRGTGSDQLVCERCGKTFSVFNGQLVENVNQSVSAKVGDAWNAGKSGDWRSAAKHGAGAFVGGAQYGVGKAMEMRPKPENSRAIILILIFLFAGWWAATYVFPGQLSAIGLSAGGWIDSIKGQVTPKITDLTEQMSDPWGKAERETKVETTVVGDVGKREGVSLDIPPGGFASLAGGATGQQLEAKVSNTGYGASNVYMYLENCEDVNEIVFNKCEDAKDCVATNIGFIRSADGDPVKTPRCYFKTDTNAIVLPSLPPDRPEPVKFYLGAEPGIATDNPEKVKTKSVQAKVALEYALEKSYRLLTYDVLSHMLSCNVEEAEALAGAKETEAYVTGGPLSVKIFATESKIKPGVPMKLSFDLVAVGSDQDTTDETITIKADTLKVYIPQTLRKLKTPNNDEWAADPTGLTSETVGASEDEKSIDCKTVDDSNKDPLGRNEPYYECILKKSVVLKENDAVRTITFNLAPQDRIPEGIGPIIISIADGGYDHKILKERAIWVTQQAGAKST